MVESFHTSNLTELDPFGKVKVDGDEDTICCACESKSVVTDRWIYQKSNGSDLNWTKTPNFGVY